jgi:hypothetical protein
VRGPELVSWPCVSPIIIKFLGEVMVILKDLC